jgi:uncharacterized membrane protein
MDFDEVVDVIGRIIEGLGVAVIVMGVLTALVRHGRGFVFTTSPTGVYDEARRSIGRSILLGLELFVAGDIIRTVVVDPTFESVGVLAVIVLIRTFLSVTLEVEITSRWPWQGDRPATGERGVS